MIKKIEIFEFEGEKIEYILSPGGENRGEPFAPFRWSLHLTLLFPRLNLRPSKPSCSLLKPSALFITDSNRDIYK